MYETINCPTCNRHLVKERQAFEAFVAKHDMRTHSANELFRTYHLQMCCLAQIVCRVDTTRALFGQDPVNDSN